MSEDLKTKVQELIDSMINPAVAGHGGEELPEIEEVLDTTDHASGSNPYYQPSK